MSSLTQEANLSFRKHNYIEKSFFVGIPLIIGYSNLNPNRPNLHDIYFTGGCPLPGYLSKSRIKKKINDKKDRDKSHLFFGGGGNTCFTHCHVGLRLYNIPSKKTLND